MHFDLFFSSGMKIGVENSYSLRGLFNESDPKKKKTSPTEHGSDKQFLYSPVSHNSNYEYLGREASAGLQLGQGSK